MRMSDGGWQMKFVSHLPSDIGHPTSSIVHRPPPGECLSNAGDANQRLHERAAYEPDVTSS